MNGKSLTRTASKMDARPLALVGGALGCVAGIIYGIILGLPVVSSNIFASMLGTGFLGLIAGAVFAAMYIQMARRRKDGKANGFVIVMMSVLVGITTGVVFFAAYAAEMTSRTNTQSFIAFLLGSVLPAMITGMLLEHADEHRPDAEQEKIEVDDENNFMKSLILRRDRIDPVKSILGSHERKIELAERPPIVAGLISIGLSGTVTAVLYWLYKGMPGWEWLMTGIESGQTRYVWGTVGFSALLGVWVILSILEKINSRSTKPQQSGGIKKRKRPFEFLLVLFCLAIPIALWGYLGWPWRDWFANAVENDRRDLLLLLMIPFGIWTVLLWLAYLASYTVLTNNGMHCGTLLDFVPGTSQRFMPRSQMANFDIRRGFIRAILRYYVVKNEGKGQNDQEWQNVIVKHGKQLKRLLQNKVS